MEKFVFTCVIVGAAIAVTGLWYQCGLALFVGVFIGGFVPMVAAEIE